MHHRRTSVLQQGGARAGEKRNCEKPYKALHLESLTVLPWGRGRGEGLDVDHFVIECEASDAGGGQCWQMLRRSFSSREISPRLRVLRSVFSTTRDQFHFSPLLSAYISSTLPIERIASSCSPTKINSIIAPLSLSPIFSKTSPKLSSPL